MTYPTISLIEWRADLFINCVKASKRRCSLFLFSSTVATENKVSTLCQSLPKEMNHTVTDLHWACYHLFTHGLILAFISKRGKGEGGRGKGKGERGKGEGGRGKGEGGRGKGGGGGGEGGGGGGGGGGGRGKGGYGTPEPFSRLCPYIHLHSHCNENRWSTHYVIYILSSNSLYVSVLPFGKESIRVEGDKKSMPMVVKGNDTEINHGVIIVKY